jgi:hypothetical protein
VWQRQEVQEVLLALMSKAAPSRPISNGKLETADVAPRTKSGRCGAKPLEVTCPRARNGQRPRYPEAALPPGVAPPRRYHADSIGMTAQRAGLSGPNAKHRFLLHVVMGAVKSTKSSASNE